MIYCGIELWRCIWLIFVNGYIPWIWRALVVDLPFNCAITLYNPLYLPT